MLLIAGCSFADNSDFPTVAFGPDVYDERCVMQLGRGGAGNYYIAQSILDNLHLADRVFVLWSGLHRIDVSIPKSARATLGTYDHMHETRDELWFHSGGFAGSWHGYSRYNYPEWIYQYLQAQYKSLDWQYLNHRSLSTVASCLAVLELQKIPYAFGFIYDIHRDYTDTQGSLGSPVDINDPVYKMIPWHRCLRSSPLEFCAERNLLQPDNFHPTREGYRQWWDTVRDQVPFDLSGPIPCNVA